MRIAVTGATGFLGRYLVGELSAAGHDVIAWRRSNSHWKTVPELFSHTRSSFENRSNSGSIRWLQGALDDSSGTDELARAADAVVHAGVFRDGEGFMDEPADPITYFQVNVMGSLRLLEAATRHRVKRFVFISSGAVHQRVSADRPLDEAHPLWPETLYGAYKSSVETLVHSYGFSGKLDCCTLRPTAIYGIADPMRDSKWYDIVRDVANHRPVNVTGGSKEVHAADVAHAARILLETESPIAGETFNCTDHVISRHEVASIAKRLCNSTSQINGQPKQAKNKMDTSKIQRLGMQFGGKALLESTIQLMLDDCVGGEGSLR